MNLEQTPNNQDSSVPFTIEGVVTRIQELHTELDTTKQHQEILRGDSEKNKELLAITEAKIRRILGEINQLQDKKLELLKENNQEEGGDTVIKDDETAFEKALRGTGEQQANDRLRARTGI